MKHVGEFPVQSKGLICIFATTVVLLLCNLFDTTTHQFKMETIREEGCDHQDFYWQTTETTQPC